MGSSSLQEYKMTSYTRRTFVKAGCGVALAVAGSGVGALAAPVGAEHNVTVSAVLQHGTADDEQRVLQQALRNREPLVWLFTGDSITQGAKHTHGWRAYPEVVAERIRWELGRARDVVINTAISGHTTVDLLGDLDWRMDRFNPHVVSLMLGTNDCATSKDVSLTRFEKNLSALVDHIRGIGAIPLVHIPAPIMVAKATERSRIAAYADVVREVSAQKRAIVTDHWQYWQEAMQQRGEQLVFSEWLNDPLHPNGAGHLELARLFFKTIGIYDEAAPTCGAPYYKGEH